MIQFSFGSSQLWYSQYFLDTQKSLQIDSLSSCRTVNRFGWGLESQKVKRDVCPFIGITRIVQDGRNFNR